MDVIRILIFIIWCSGITCVYIQNNGYKGIIISFSEKALGESFDFLKLEDVLKNASEILFHATRRRSYFEEFIFVLPSTWKDEEVCDELITVAPNNIDIYVTDSQHVSSITAQHSKNCGEKGDIIYLPRDWLKGDIEDLALQFVREWSTYRYGVFSEDPERPGSCISDFTSSKWSPTGCYNIDLDEQVQANENGLPQCDFPSDFSERDGLRSSIMFSANSSKVLDFCDGSESYPHNPVAPTLHNRICERKPVWSVVKSTDDFLYGRNMPMENTEPPKSPTFRCFKESKMHLTIMVQNTDTEARSEIRYALLYFLSIIEPADYSVTLGTYSNDSNSEEFDSVDLSLEDKDNIKAILEDKVTLNEEVPNICLACGLKKAYKISKKSQISPRTIIVLSRETSLEKSDISELINFIQDDANVTLHLLFLEDTTSDIIPSSLVDAVESMKGRIFRVKNDPVYMLTELTLALLEASKNVLHVEDEFIVVHKREYVNVTSNISDIFVIPRNTRGKLLYTMQFKKRGDIKNINNDCIIADDDLQSPICGSQISVPSEENFKKIWNYSFRYTAGSKGTTCTSLALLKLQSPSENPFRIKGWFNENKVTPGLNALKIYAEVYARLAKIVQVQAIISGPGLTDHRLELRDNGNGDPDIKEKDHIYSRYFTSFTQKGTYVVSIYVEALEIEHSHLYNEERDSLEKLTQTKIVGTFRVTHSPPEEDMIPPNQVADLTVTSINSKNREVALQWTAPGGNYDDGKANNYIFKLSNHWTTLVDFAFDLMENVLLNTNDKYPTINGTVESVRVQCLECNYNKTYYIAFRAIDDKNNVGKVSNIVQIFFLTFPTNDTVETSTNTEISTNHDKMTSDIKFSTGMSTISTDDSTTSDATTETSVVNTTSILNEFKDGIFIEKNTFIIATSCLGAFILILIIIIIVVSCCCCKRRVSKEPKTISKKMALRPPYNINIAYKPGSETSMEEEHPVSNSVNTLVEQNSEYSRPVRRDSQEKRYSYHTDKSLKNKMGGQTRKNDLGFKLVQPMPAYATSSLSRFAARHIDSDDEDTESPKERSNVVPLQKLNNTEEAHIYPLGEV